MSEVPFQSALAGRFLLSAVRRQKVRHPRKAGGLMSWAASKAVGHESRRRALRAYLVSSELSATIRGILLADVLANLL